MNSNLIYHNRRARILLKKSKQGSNSECIELSVDQYIEMSERKRSIKRNFKGVNRVTIARSSFTTNYSPKSDGEQQKHNQTTKALFSKRYIIV